MTSSRFAPVGDTRIAYRVSGAGPPVVMIGGTGYSGHTWHPAYCEAVAAHCTLVTIDHRGTGDSPGTRGDYTTQMFADDALAVLDHAGIDGAHLVGHSMGGRVAQLMARAGERVKTLVLASSGAGNERTLPVGQVGVPHGTALELIRTGFNESYFRQAQLRTFWTSAYAAAHPAEVEWLAQAFWGTAPDLEDYLKHVRARQAHSSVSILPDLTLPTLVLVGEQDTHVGGTGSHLQRAQELHQALPHSQLIVLPGLKHGVFWEAPSLMADLVVRWVAVHDPGDDSGDDLGSDSGRDSGHASRHASGGRQAADVTSP
jgi:pimeloyl-ACP methyl ester carboxylesterase